jgi:hypothetical protein
MVQVLPAVESFGAEFGRAIGNSINEGVSERLKSQKEIKQIKQENETAKAMGFDLSGISDPKTRQQMFALAMQGKNQKELEEKKQSGKKDILTNKQNFLNKILHPEKNVSSDQLENKQVSQSGFDASKISDEDIIEAEALGLRGLREAKDAALKKTEGDKKEERRQFESERDFHTKASDPIVKAAEGVVRETPIKKGLISQQRRDIASGNTSGIIPFMVDKLGLEAYRDPESARFKTASKERFVSSVHELGSSGARANQFIEQQLVAAQAALGRSEEANQSVLDLEEFINDAKETRAQLELDLAEQDMKEFGYAKRDISNRADKLMKPYIEQRQDEMAYDIRKRHEENLDDEGLTKEIVSGNIGKDTPLTVRAARILMIKNNDDEKKAQAEAKKLGFRFPSEKTYQRQ